MVVEGGKSEFEVPVEFPEKIRVAGIIWIIAGSLSLLGLLIYLALMFPSLAFPGQILGISVLGIVGGVPAYFGLRCISGKAKSTLVYGIISIILGIKLVLVGAILCWAGAVFVGWESSVPGSIFLVAGGPLLVAGKLAIQARGHYEAWRRTIRSSSSSVIRRGGGSIEE